MATVVSYDNEQNTVTIRLTEEESRMVAQTMQEGATISTYLRVDKPKAEA